MASSPSPSTSYLLDQNTTSLISFFERNLSTLKLDAHTECTAARYAFAQKIKHSEKLMQGLQSILANPPEGTQLTPETTFAIMRQINSLADDIIRASGFLTRTLKTATEIEVLSNTHFDSIQLFYLINQLPALITAKINDSLFNFISTLLDKAERTSVRAARLSLDLELASFINELVTTLTSSLQNEITVLERSNSQSSIPATNIVEEQLASMEALTCPQT